MEYYLYISRSKLDMLFPQVPHKIKKKYSAEFGVNIGLLKTKAAAEFAEEQSSADAHRVAIVADYIRKHEDVARLDDAQEWVEDEIEVKHLVVRDNPKVFLLVGEKDGQIHLLGGSSRHLIGAVPPTDADSGYSFFPHLVKNLEDVFSAENAKSAATEYFVFGKLDNDIAGLRPHEWADIVYWLNRQATGEPMVVRFLGRHLARGRSLYQLECTVCSPLYVALR